MSDDNEQEHKTMIKQLTDLDDHALDEQAAIKPRVGLRSVSLTRIAGERTDASATTAATSKSGGSGNVSGRDSTAGPDNRHSGKAGGIIGYHSAQTSDAPLNPTKILRAGTPIETPTEEGDRQLSVETSRPNKAAGKRASNRRSANDRAAPAKTGRLFVRRVNASSRGSEEENSDDDEEQFIYRNSRSSLHVSSIPEDAYEDREPVGQSRRRTNRHRLSTYLGSIERRDSSGVGGALSTGGSYGQTYSSSATAHGNSNSINYGANNASSGGHTTATASGGGRAGGRRPGRTMRGGANGSSVNASVGFSSSGGGGGGAGGGAGHRFSILTQANNDYGGGTSEESDMDGEPAGLRSTYANQYSRRNSRRFQSNVYYGSSEDLPETTPLFRRHHGQQRKRKSAIAQVLRAAFLTLVLLASLFVLVILFNFTSAPLADVEAVRVSNILATEKELLFILHIQSTNPNIREVLIERAEIGVFAAAAVSNNTTAQPDRALLANETEPAILLGNVYKLSDPMRFAPGSLQKPTTDIQTTQISIHHPGATLGGGGGGGGDGEDDDSDASKWRRLLKGPYDLTVRGTLQYTLWQRNYAARICVAKLANLPPDNSTSSGMISYSIAAGLGCDEGDDDDTITLPSPPTPPFYLAQAVRRLPRLW
ncbi:Vacuolar inheritance and morphology protein [Coemansia erecta]|uniref:Vacuolar inheritance and morphology protein n=1 Tax=Coemansia erecta TaxID=147472 RepID=A0A9W7XUJ5_9FUNG|nr:Vacuolar inheritance and morphology protein [Coemansia erecta]